LPPDAALGADGGRCRVVKKFDALNSISPNTGSITGWRLAWSSGSALGGQDASSGAVAAAQRVIETSPSRHRSRPAFGCDDAGPDA
jgi:hypothetical protein